MTYLCTKTVTISSRGPPNLSNFLFETQPIRGRIKAVFASCVLCLHSAFCVMLGTKTMLGARDNMEFINIY